MAERQPSFYRRRSLLSPLSHTHLLGLPDRSCELPPVRLGRLGQLHPVLDPQSFGLGHQGGSSQALCLGASQLRMLIADTELEKGGVKDSGMCAPPDENTKQRQQNDDSPIPAVTCQRPPEGCPPVLMLQHLPLPVHLLLPPDL